MALATIKNIKTKDNNYHKQTQEATRNTNKDTPHPTQQQYTSNYNNQQHSATFRITQPQPTSTINTLQQTAKNNIHHQITQRYNNT